MWTALVHLPGPICGTVAFIISLGISTRSVFRYPHLWRYLESRIQVKHDCHSNGRKCACATGSCPPHSSAGASKLPARQLWHAARSSTQSEDLPDSRVDLPGEFDPA